MALTQLPLNSILANPEALRAFSEFAKQEYSDHFVLFHLAVVKFTGRAVALGHRYRVRERETQLQNSKTAEADVGSKTIADEGGEQGSEKSAGIGEAKPAHEPSDEGSATVADTQEVEYDGAFASLLKFAQEIYEMYVASGSPSDVGVGGAAAKAVLNELSNPGPTLNPLIFAEAQNGVLRALKDPHIRFLHSSGFEGLVRRLTWQLFELCEPSPADGDFFGSDLQWETVLHNPVGMELLSSFMKTERSEEILTFYVQVQEFKGIDSRQMKRQSALIYKWFLKEEGKSHITIPMRIRKDIREALESPDCDMFDHAQRHCQFLLKHDIFIRFRKSKKFREFSKEFQENLWMYEPEDYQPSNAHLTEELANQEQRIQGMAKLVRAESLFADDVHFMTPTRVCIKDGRLRRIKKLSEQTLHLLLFNDIVVFGECCKRSQLLRFLYEVDVASLTVENVDHLGDRQAFRLKSDHKSWVLCAHSRPERTSWVHAIQKAKTDLALAADDKAWEATDVCSSLNRVNRSKQPTARIRRASMSSTTMSPERRSLVAPFSNFEPIKTRFQDQRDVLTMLRRHDSGSSISHAVHSESSRGGFRPLPRNGQCTSRTARASAQQTCIPEDPDDVSEVLTMLGMREYLPAFQQQRIQYRDLAYLASEDWEVLIPEIGPRRRIQAYLSSRQEQPRIVLDRHGHAVDIPWVPAQTVADFLERVKLEHGLSQGCTPQSLTLHIFLPTRHMGPSGDSPTASPHSIPRYSSLDGANLTPYSSQPQSISPPAPLSPTDSVPTAHSLPGSPDLFHHAVSVSGRVSPRASPREALRRSLRGTKSGNLTASYSYPVGFPTLPQHMLDRRQTPPGPGTSHPSPVMPRSADSDTEIPPSLRLGRRRTRGNNNGAKGRQRR